MTLTKFSWNEVRARPLRILLTFLSIAIGVAAVVAVLLATSTTRAAQRNMLKAISGRADLEILANTPKGFAYDLIQSVRENAQVAVAIPSLHRVATLFASAGETETKTRTQVFGIDPRIDQQIRDYSLIQGSVLSSLQHVVVDESLAVSLGLSVGDAIRLLGSGGLKEYQLVGIVRPTGASGVSLGGAVYLVLPAAQELFRAGSNVDQILVLAVDRQQLSTLYNELKLQCGESVTIRIPRTSSDMARETMYATENGMLMAIAFALLIAIFIIYNTFQMAVGERRKQLGILRAIGATRSQVSAVILKEAFFLSILGSLAGCIFGYWGAGLLNEVTASVLDVDLPRLELKWLPLLAATIVGVSVAMLGAWIPARRAGQVQPMEAMRAVEIEHNEDVIRLTKPVGLIAIPAGSVLLDLAFRGWLPVGGDVVAIVLILLGCVSLIPLVLGSFVAAVGGFLQRWLGFESKLAQKQVMRHVGRSALTVGVLFIAVSTSVGMTGNILDNVENVRSWYSRAFVGDFFVRASTPDLATGSSAELPLNTSDAIAEMEGVKNVSTLSLVTAQSGQDSLLVIVREFQGKARDYFDLVAGRESRVIVALNHGEAVIGSVLAQRRGLKPGDSISLETVRGTIELPIAATTNEYVAGGLTVYLSREIARKQLGVEGASALIVNATENHLSSVEQQLQEFARSRGLIVQSHKEMIEYIRSLVNGVIASMWVLLGIGCSIAAMGLVNTLTMNILEQTREIGMLRVVAMTRQQVRRMVFAQAALLGALGLIPGAIAGVFVAYAISQSAMMVLGHNVIFQFRPALVVGCVVMGAMVIALASLLPAERAARLRISTALHCD